MLYQEMAELHVCGPFPFPLLSLLLFLSLSYGLQLLLA
jgi:hypothetical protein